jgi:hypothetical protein
MSSHLDVEDNSEDDTEELFSEMNLESYAREDKGGGRSTDIIDEGEDGDGPSAAHAPAKSAMMQSDADGDGELSNVEFAAALKTMGMSASSPDFTRAMDGDGINNVFTGRKVSLSRTADGRNRFVRAKSTQCTDISGIFLFILSMVVTALIANFVLTNGDLKTLFFAKDRNGDYCGANNEPQGKDWTAATNVFYPAIDDASQYRLSLSMEDMDGICLARCPAFGETYTNYLLESNQQRQHQTARFDYVPYFNRCVPRVSGDAIDLVLCVEENTDICSNTSEVYQLTGSVKLSSLNATSVFSAEQERAMRRSIADALSSFLTSELISKRGRVLAVQVALLSTHTSTSNSSASVVYGVTGLTTDVIQVVVAATRDECSVPLCQHTLTFQDALTAQVHVQVAALEDVLSATAAAAPTAAPTGTLRELAADPTGTLRELSYIRPTTTVSGFARPACCSSNPDGGFVPLLCRVKGGGLSGECNQQRLPTSTSSGSGASGASGASGEDGLFSGLDSRSVDTRKRCCAQAIQEQCSVVDAGGSKVGVGLGGWACKEYRVTEADFMRPKLWKRGPIQEQLKTIMKIVGLTIADCFASFQLVLIIGCFTYLQGGLWLYAVRWCAVPIYFAWIYFAWISFASPTAAARCCTHALLTIICMYPLTDLPLLLVSDNPPSPLPPPPLSPLPPSPLPTSLGDRYVAPIIWISISCAVLLPFAIAIACYVKVSVERVEAPSAQLDPDKQMHATVRSLR